MEFIHVLNFIESKMYKFIQFRPSFWKFEFLSFQSSDLELEDFGLVAVKFHENFTQIAQNRGFCQLQMKD